MDIYIYIYIYRERERYVHLCIMTWPSYCRYLFVCSIFCKQKVHARIRNIAQNDRRWQDTQLRADNLGHVWAVSLGARLCRARGQSRLW